MTHRACALAYVVTCAAMLSGVAGETASAQCEPRWASGFDRIGPEREPEYIMPWRRGNADSLLAFGFLGAIDGSRDRGVPVVAEWDGTRWTNLGSSNGRVAAHCRWQDKDVLVGTFTSFLGSTATGIAMWDGASWSFPRMHRFPDYQDVYDVIEYQGTLIYAGVTLVAENGSYGPLIQFDGTEYSTFGNEDLQITRGLFSVESMVIIGNKLYVAGRASLSQNEQASLVLEWDGAVWRQIAQTVPSYSSSITDIATNGQDLFIFGVDMTLNGIVCGPAAKFDGQMITRLGTALEFAPLRFLRRSGISTFNGQPLIGGRLFGMENQQLLTVQNEEWVQAGPATGLPALAAPNRVVQRVLNFRDTLVITGSLNGTNEDTDWSVADLREGRWQPLGTGIDAPLTSILSTEGGILASGRVWHAGLERAAGVVLRDGDRWVDASAGLSRTVNAQHTPNKLYRQANGDMLLAGRLYFESGSVSVLARRVDGRWEPVGATPSADVARDVVEHDGNVYVVGQLTCSDGVSRAIRRWDGAAWQDVSGAPTGTGACVISTPEGLVVGGLQMVHPTLGAGNVMRLRDGTWENLNTPDITVNALYQSDGVLLAGGTQGVRERSGGGWIVKGIGLTGTVSNLFEYQGNLHAIGTFHMQDNEGGSLARLGSDGVWRPVAGGLARRTSAGAPTSAVVAGPSLYIAGNFDSVGLTSAPSYGLARLDCTCPSDWDLDGDVDFFDYLDFVDQYAGGSADFNRDDVTDWFDYLDFVQAFAAGC